MNEIYRQLVVILHGMWQRRWHALATAWAVTLVGWGVVATMPDQYNSSARVYIDTQSSLQPLMQGLAVDTNPLAKVAMMQRTLLSRPNLERVARMTDMDLAVRNDAQMQRLVDELSRNVSISSQGGNLFRISYMSEDPQQAEAVVQALLTIFVEGNLGESRTDLASAQNFIDKQLRAYEKQLEAIERKRAEFRRKNGSVLPGDGNYYQKIEEAEAALAKLQKEYDETQITRKQLAQQFENVPRYLKLTTPVGPGGVGGGAAGSESASLVSRINQLEQNITNLKLKGYTDKHPDVVMTRRMLESAREELKAARANAEGEGGDGEELQANQTVVNPVYDQLQIKLIDVDSRLATLKAQIEEQKQLIARLENVSEDSPNLAARQLKLERDYNVIRKQYEALLARKESAQLAQDIETGASIVEFRVIDPPEVPVTPSGPNRPLFLSAALILGLGAGAALAFVVSQIHTTFSTVERLKNHFNLPVLGTISKVVSPTERREQRLRLAMFSVVLAGLFVTFGGLMAVELVLKPGMF